MANRSDRARRERVGRVGYDYAAQPKVLRKTCNLCGSDRYAVIATEDRYGFPARAQMCLRCGLGCQNPLLTPEAYADFYRSAYRPIISAFKGKPVSVDRIEGIEKKFAADIDDLLLGRFIDPSVHRSVVDIGGSVGVVAEHFRKKYGMTATVLDPSDHELAEAKARGLRTIHGLLEQHDFTGETFDVVLLCKTVDHFFDLDRALATIRSIISPSGLFFLDHNDFQALYIAFQSVERVVQVDHCYYLFRETMQLFLRKHGFKVRAVDIARDPWTVSYVCSPAEPQRVPETLPYVDEYLTEMRRIKNVPYALQRQVDSVWTGVARRTRQRVREAIGR